MLTLHTSVSFYWSTVLAIKKYISSALQHRITFMTGSSKVEVSEYWHCEPNTKSKNGESHQIFSNTNSKKLHDSKSN